MSAVGYVVGEVRTDEFTFVTNSEITPPRLEYVVLRDVQERVGDDVRRMDVLAQVTGLSVSSRLLNTGMSYSEVEAILARLRSAPPIIIGTATVLGYLDPHNIVRYPRGAAAPGAEVHKAEDALLERFFSKVESGMKIGSLINRPQVGVDCDPNGLRRHLAVIAQTGAGKSYTVGVLLEQLLTLGGTVVVFDPNSDYVLMRRDDANHPTPFADRVEIYRLPSQKKGRFTDADTGPSRKFEVNFAKLDFEEICTLCGLPPAFANIRQAIQVVYNQLRGRDYGPEHFRKALERIANRIEGVDDDGLDAPRRAPLNPSVGDGDEFSRFARRRWADKAGLGSDDETEAGDIAEGDLWDSMGQDRDAEPPVATPRSVPVGGDGGASGGQYSPDVVSGAQKAVKYIQALERMDIWGFGDIPLPDMLRPMTLSAIDLAGMDSTVSDYVVWKVLNDTWRRAVTEGLPRPVFFVLEEAHNFIPGGAAKGEAGQAASIIRRISAEGRKFGIFLVLVTQRPYKVHSDVLSQCNSQIIMRLTNPQDQQAVKQAAEGISEGLLADLPGLNVGEAVILGPLVRVPVMVRINPRLSREGGADMDVVKALERARSEVITVGMAARAKAERQSRPRTEWEEEV
ncbi:MAG: ATP-binding protein [Anaerolineae bacterium]|nr:ATP-binding protein [Anaerolineae bacterium]